MGRGYFRSDWSGQPKLKGLEDVFSQPKPSLSGRAAHQHPTPGLLPAAVPVCSWCRARCASSQHPVPEAGASALCAAGKVGRDTDVPAQLTAGTEQGMC